MMLRVLDFASARHRELALLLGKRKARAQQRQQRRRQQQQQQQQHEQQQQEEEGGSPAATGTATTADGATSNAGGGIRIERRLRRRTTSHKRRKGFVFTVLGQQQLLQRRRKRRRLLEQQESDGLKIKKKPLVPLAQLPRPLRRRLELRRGTAGWDVDPGPGRLRRLETHAWHAKRMRMSSSSFSTVTWGFSLGLSATWTPSKAVVRAARERCVLHDASYTRVLELSAPAADSIVALLAPCFDPVDVSDALTAPAVMNGARAADAMLYRPGCFPQHPLGPLRLLWRPNKRNEEEGEPDGDPTTTAAAALWLLLHPAFADEATACLQQQAAANTASASAIVHIRPVPDLLCFEARGPGAHPLIQRILRSSSPSSSSPSCEGNNLWAGLLQHVSSARPECFPPHGTVLALEVLDPRESRPCRGGKDLLVEEEQERGRRRKANKTRRLKLQALLHGGGWPVAAAGGGGYGRSVWSEEGRAVAAFAAKRRTDAVVNEGRRRRRQGGTWQGVLAAGAASGGQGAGEKEEEGEEATAVPVLLVARGGRGSKGFFLDGGALSGYDILIPRGWGRPFWHALLGSHRGRATPRAVGLEDRERLALEFGLPAFPRDCVETAAGRAYWSAALAAEAARQKRRPVWKRVPIQGGLPSEWDERAVVWRRAAAVEAAVAVRGSGFMGRIFPAAPAAALVGEEEGRVSAAPPSAPSHGSAAATSLLPPLHYRRLRGDMAPSAAYAVADASALVPVLLHCRWGGHPCPFATILAPAPADYRAWRAEQAIVAGQRKQRAAALQAAAQRREAAMPTSMLLPSPPSTTAAVASSKQPWPPTTRPPSLPPGATARQVLGHVSSAGFVLGAGHAMAHALLSVHALRAWQAGAGKGVPGPMACVVLVQNSRAGAAVPVSLHLWFHE